MLTIFLAGAGAGLLVGLGLGMAWSDLRWRQWAERLAGARG